MPERDCARRPARTGGGRVSRESRHGSQGHASLCLPWDDDGGPCATPTQSLLEAEVSLKMPVVVTEAWRIFWLLFEGKSSLRCFAFLASSLYFGKL